MRYEVRLSPAARRQLLGLAEPYFSAVSRAIDSLEPDPRPSRAKKLAGSGLWRICAGRYRIVYAIGDRERLVIIVRVVRRSEGTYRGL